MHQVEARLKEEEAQLEEERRRLRELEENKVGRRENIVHSSQMKQQ